VKLSADRAEELYLQAAKAGHVQAMFHLGWLYLSPDFHPDRGVRWFERGSTAGCGECAVALGQLYSCGVGVFADPARAELYFRRAVELGEPVGHDGLRGLTDRYAQPVQRTASLGLFEGGWGYEPAALEWVRRAFNLGGWDGVHDIGLAYYRGEGVREDIVTATRFVLAAAENGCVPAFVTLARMHAFGRGLPPDGKRAEQWLLRAADAGNVDAHYYLGWLFDTGRVVKKDRRRAIEWYRKAAELGDEGAKEKLAELGG
jgi:TPR repeat protein